MKELHSARRALVRIASPPATAATPPLGPAQASARARCTDRSPDRRVFLRCTHSLDPPAGRFDILSASPRQQLPRSPCWSRCPSSGPLAQCAASLAGLAPISRRQHRSKHVRGDALLCAKLSICQLSSRPLQPRRPSTSSLAAGNTQSRAHRDQRKLLILANALLRYRRTCTPNRYQHSSVELAGTGRLRLPLALPCAGSPPRGAGSANRSNPGIGARPPEFAGSETGIDMQPASQTTLEVDA